MSLPLVLSRSLSKPISDKHFVWSNSDDDNNSMQAFAESLETSPLLCPSTFGESNSWCLDILSLPHNAVRQELCDMFTMYRAMADLGNTLSYHDVKMSTLWFRTFAKFLLQNVLAWQVEILFPWFCRRTKLEPRSQATMTKLFTTHETIVKLTQIALTKQARLSKEVSSQARADLIPVQLLDTVLSCVDLAERIAVYLREAETFVVPILYDRGVRTDDRDILFTQLSLRIQEAQTERMDIPILIRWMPWRDQRAWLKEHLVDPRRKIIPLSIYTKWQNDHFDLMHRRYVEEMLQKANKM